MVPSMLRAVIGAGGLIAASVPGTSAETAQAFYSKNKIRLVIGAGPAGAATIPMRGLWRGSFPITCRASPG